MKNIYFRIPELSIIHKDLALATVVSSSGSTPQKPGCSALFGAGGLLSGTIGGGVIENKIALIVSQTNKSGYFSFSLDSDIHHTDEAVCGGRMDVLIDSEPMSHRPVWKQISGSLQNGIPGTLVTTVLKGSNDSVTISRQWYPGKPVDSGFSMTGEKGTLIFNEPLFPPSRLVIVGAGHIGKALAHLGNLLEFEITVIDNRPEYANKENIPDADHVIADDVANAMEQLEKRADTYIVIVTHGHKNDAEALRHCVGSGAAYIGMIGSRRKIALMRDQFVQQNWTTAKQWDKIHAPVGLNIGSQSVQEIAVSIAAELVLVRNTNTHNYA